ncbi:MAG TPA: hypothetical protein VJK02_24330, partial [Anaerolineales bacterium]|nr:hypothetical protein [Anaerolineales bacterium]
METETTSHALAERLLPAVRQVMEVYDVTPGHARAGYAARYRGRLTIDSAEAYERLEPAFEREDMTLLFRKGSPDHIALAVPGRIRPGATNPWINLALFAATLISVLIAGASTEASVGANDSSVLGFLMALMRALPSGLPFAG